MDQSRIAQPRSFWPSDKAIGLVCKQVVSSAIFLLLITLLAGYLPLCLNDPTFEGIFVIEMAGLCLWLVWEEQFSRLAGYLPVCRHNPTSKTITAELPTSFHAQFLTLKISGFHISWSISEVLLYLFTVKSGWEPVTGPRYNRNASFNYKNNTSGKTQ